MTPASTPPNKPVRRASGGRPPKFAEPSRPVTLTLPEHTLDGLLLIDDDRSQAIVKLTQEALQKNGGQERLVQVVEVKDGKGVLIVASSKSLKQIPFLHLVKVSAGRFLLALDPGNGFKTLELSVLDMLEITPAEDEREVRLLSELLIEVRKLRQSSRVSLAEILFVDLDQK